MNWQDLALGLLAAWLGIVAVVALPLSIVFVVYRRRAKADWERAVAEHDERVESIRSGARRTKHRFHL